MKSIFALRNPFGMAGVVQCPVCKNYIGVGPDQERSEALRVHIFLDHSSSPANIRGRRLVSSLHNPKFVPASFYRQIPGRGIRTRSNPGLNLGYRGGPVPRRMVLRNPEERLSPYEWKLFELEAESVNEAFLLCPRCQRKVASLFCFAKSPYEAEVKFFQDPEKDYACGWDTCHLISNEDMIIASMKKVPTVARK